MAKKKRKLKRAPTAASATAGAPKARPHAPRAPSYEPPDFSQEYRYVYYDLRRIASIAAAMLAILVILAFIIG